MTRLDVQEGQRVELKRQWVDSALRDLAAFANSEGGRLYVGIAKDGEVVGAPAEDADIERIANTVTSTLGLTPSIRVELHEDKPVIVVDVEPVQRVVPYRGRYFCRVGSTNRDLPPEELRRLILQRSGHTWDALPSDWGPDRCAPEALERFAHLARERLPHVDPNQPERTLHNLELLSDGRLTNGGVLLFGSAPQRLFPLARLRIGVFRSPTQIVDSHEFGGTLWEQVDGAMERFRRLLRVAFDVKATAPTAEGLQRKDVWEYPLDALREAVINTLIHRDYTMTADIQIRLYDDRLEVWNPGELPPPLSPEALRGPHGSYPRNPLLARAFYHAGMIEQWGTGTTKIIALCREQGLPEPEFANWQGGLRLSFAKDPFTRERLEAMGLNERQVQAVLYVKQHGAIGNKDLQELTGASKPTITRDFDELVKRAILSREGERGPGTRYVLKGS